MYVQRSIRAAVISLFAVSLFAWPAADTRATAASSTTFSGRATVLNVTLAGIVIGPIVDTGEVSASGGELEASLLEYPISGLPDPTGGDLSAQVLHAAVVARGNKSNAEASVANLALSLGEEQSVSAAFLMARAEAKCTGSTASVSGSSEVVELVVNGTPVSVSGSVNQTIPIPGGSVIINEQIASVSASGGDITVNALHITFTDPLGMTTDITVASAHADILCGAQGACPNKDFVTGGGWITTPSGSRANFAVAGGIKNGAFWGHLLYIDHGNPGLKVKGTAVTGYEATGATSRHIRGTTEAGTYDVDVTDGGEPGHGVDFFALLLTPSGYRAGGLLDGGNIQLHCK